MLSMLAWGVGLYFAVSVVVSLLVGRLLRNVSAAYPLFDEGLVERGAEPVVYVPATSLGSLGGSRSVA